MDYYVIVENNNIIACGNAPCSDDGIINVLVNEELYNQVKLDKEKYIYSNGAIIVNPEYEEQQAERRKARFYGDFFRTSLGFIRRKVSMKTGEIKDFLTDLLPVISMAVSQGQAVNIITYREPDSWLQDVVNWEELQTVKVATPQFIQECFNQVSTDFSGVQ